MLVDLLGNVETPRVRHEIEQHSDPARVTPGGDIRLQVGDDARGRVARSDRLSESKGGEVPLKAFLPVATGVGAERL